MVQVPYLKGNEKQLHNEVSTKSLRSGNFEDSVALKRFLGASQLTSWYCKKGYNSMYVDLSSVTDSESTVTPIPFSTLLHPPVKVGGRIEFIWDMDG